MRAPKEVGSDPSYSQAKSMGNDIFMVSLKYLCQAGQAQKQRGWSVFSILEASIIPDFSNKKENA